jgi:hypothetical protein
MGADADLLELDTGLLERNATAGGKSRGLLERNIGGRRRGGRAHAGNSASASLLLLERVQRESGKARKGEAGSDGRTAATGRQRATEGRRGIASPSIESCV